MKNLTRPFTRRVWLAAVAVTAAVAAGIVAGPGSATLPIRANYNPYPPKAAKFKTPKLKQEWEWEADEAPMERLT